MKIFSNLSVSTHIREIDKIVLQDSCVIEMYVNKFTSNKINVYEKYTLRKSNIKTQYHRH